MSLPVYTSHIVTEEEWAKNSADSSEEGCIFVTDSEGYRDCGSTPVTAS